MDHSTEPCRIVIVGAGAGGLPLACQLGRQYKKSPDVQILLVDQSIVHIWKPLLHEVAAGTLTSNDDEINLFSHGEQHGYEFELGELCGLNRNERTVQLAELKDNRDQEILPARDIAYDYLIMAVGATCDDFDTSGVEEHAIFIDDRASAELCHRRFVHSLLRRHYIKRAGSRNIVIIGAGATGVELAAQLQWVIDSQDELGLDDEADEPMQLVLLEAAEQILPALDAKLAARLHRELKDMKIDVRVDTMVESIEAGMVKTPDGDIEAGLIIWAAGIKAHDWLAKLGLETDSKDRVVTTDTLRSVTDARIFAMGDCAAVPHGDDTVPALAQAAYQQANYLAREIPKMLRGAPGETSFQFINRGTLVTVAEQDAGGNVRFPLIEKLRIKGWLAQIAYRSLYRRHQLSILGPWNTFVAMLKSALSRSAGPHSAGPRLKLH